MGRRMLAPWVLGASALAAQDVQVTVPTPYVPGQQGPMGEREYGTPRVVELASLDFNPETYQRAHIITMGVLDLLWGGYFTLKDGGPPVLVIPGHEVSGGDLMALAGRRVEVRGIFRRIRKKEYIKGVDLDLIEDPSLPVLPEIDTKLPRNSITVLSITDRGEGGGDDERPPTAAVVREILENPAEHADRKVRLVGQFRGRNLFSDLPASSQRSRSDWVLKDGDTAVWITGKDPRGKGWALDATYRGDTARFVMVEGKPEVANGIVYLRASKVMLAAPPAAETADDDAP